MFIKQKNIFNICNNILSNIQNDNKNYNKFIKLLDKLILEFDINNTLGYTSKDDLNNLDNLYNEINNLFNSNDKIFNCTNIDNSQSFVQELKYKKFNLLKKLLSKILIYKHFLKNYDYLIKKLILYLLCNLQTKINNLKDNIHTIIDDNKCKTYENQLYSSINTLNCLIKLSKIYNLFLVKKEKLKKYITNTIDDTKLITTNISDISNNKPNNKPNHKFNNYKFNNYIPNNYKRYNYKFNNHNRYGNQFNYLNTKFHQFNHSKTNRTRFNSNNAQFYISQC